jgi:hypothetical protein
MIKKFLSLIFNSLLIGAVFAMPASASAGAVKTYVGAWEEVSACLPKNHSKVIYLQGTKQGSDWRTFAKFKPKLIGPTTLCPKGQMEYGFDWKVNIRGEYALYFYDPVSKKRSYCWPDWIDSN